MTTSFSHDSAQLAETYDRLSDSQFEGGKLLVDRMGVGRGERVLDVGCGTGRLARWIAERIAPGGHVVGIDPLVDRITLARSRPVAGLSFDVGQAEDLSAFADGSFDAVCMSAVLHWVSDKPKALAQVRRVLRPGGRLGVTTVPRETMGASTVTQVCGPVLGRAPYAEKVDLSALALASRGHTTSELISMVLESGLELAELHVVKRTRTHPSGEDAVDFIESSSFGNFLRMVPEELRPSLRADLVAAFEARKGPDGIVRRDYGTVLVATRASG
jgi:ubiquinone/menaquinone biosynthesis C-methylase UbiE